MAHRLSVQGPGAPPWSTKIVVAPRALELAARGIAAGFTGARFVVVSDGRVARLYGRRFQRLLSARGRSPDLLTFPPGERFKSRETKARLEDRLLALAVGRDTVVIALGGGVTGDLAGLLAATWHRGVPWVAIPTTLLAMVDAGLGGKTAVDIPGGKNAVGAFHQPVSLWADVNVLRTLPERDYRAGLAEAVKTAVVLDAALFRRLEREVAPLIARDARRVASLVARCLALKGRVVSADARDGGLRAILNFGHTAAHAIEEATDYRVSHGEAVAIGLVAEARLAERATGLPRADADRIEALLGAFGLPVRPPRGLDTQRWLAAARRDKKTRSGIVRAVLPERIGRMPDGPDPSLAIDAELELLPHLVRN